MQKRIIWMLVIILIMVFTGVGSYFLGSSQGSRNLVKQSDGASHRKEARNIAVVNLDEGTSASGKEKVFYGEKVIRFPNESFAYTSLEDARKGIDNGSYAAYIIIPATFSDSIDSLNGTPTSAVLQYAMNKELTGNLQAEILYQVMSFGESLNTDLSYMYLANILREFHEAQDETVLVMANDLKDKAAIDEIRALDLVAMVSVPVLDRPDNPATPLDLSAFMETNSGLVDRIDENYRSNIQDAQAQLTSIQDSGIVLGTALNAISSDTEEINLTIDDEDGKNLYEDGLLSLTVYPNFRCRNRDYDGSIRCQIYNR